jgi:hypothetical protein
MLRSWFYCCGVRYELLSRQNSFGFQESSTICRSDECCSEPMAIDAHLPVDKQLKEFEKKSSN